MKRHSGKFALALIMLTGLCSCSVYTYPVSMERRNPSKLGMDLSGRSLSVTFVHSDPADSVFQSELAEGFICGLEELFFGGERAIDLFAMPASTGADYSSRDTLVQLAVATDADFVFIFDSTRFIMDPQTGDTLQLRANLYAYDTMDKADTVRTFYAIKNYERRDTAFVANLGKSMSRPFESTWTNETNQIYFYDEPSWLEAADCTARYEWKKALSLWTDILSKTHDSQKRAYASYNIAFCCYMEGSYSLANAWLDRALKEAEVPQAAVLRRRISAMATD